MNWRALLPMALFLVLVIGLGVAMLLRDPDKIDTPLLDQPFPEFSLSTLNDPNEILTRDDILGRISIVNVYGSWCAGCITEHPKLMEIAESKEVDLIGVNWRDTREKGHNFLARLGNPYDLIIFDEISELAVGLGVTGAPETYLIDHNGIIRFKHIGPITDEVWANDFRPRIAKLESGA